MDLDLDVTLVTLNDAHDYKIYSTNLAAVRASRPSTRTWVTIRMWLPADFQGANDAHI
jgi:hypothetical protein